MLALLQLRLGNLGLVAAAVAVGFPLLMLIQGRVEKWRRARFSPSDSGDSLRLDLGYWVLSPVVETLSRTLSTVGLALCALALGKRVGPDLLDGFGPVVQQPRWAVLLEMLVLGDLIYYWSHRLAHTVPFLWRFHAVHHSTRHLRWASALRAHPFEVYIHTVNLVPLFLLGFPVDALAPLLPFITLYSFVIHSDLRLRARRLGVVLNTPHFHRWHHALDVKDGTKNYAGLFPFFDVMFGTYHLPEQAPQALGIDDAKMPDTLVAQILYPLARPDRAPQVDALVTEQTAGVTATLRRAT